MATSTYLRCLGIVCAGWTAACAPQSTLSVESPSQPLILPGSAASPAASSSSSGSATEPGALDERESRQLARTWGWLLAGGVGGVAGVVALGTSVVMLVDMNTRSNDCNTARVCSPSGLEANSQIASIADWNAGAWIIAAAGLGTGAYLLLTNPTDRAKGTQVGVVPNGAGANVSLRTVF